MEILSACIPQFPVQGRSASSTCNPAILNFNDPATLLCNARIVGDNDYRAAILMQFLEYAHNFLRRSGIQRSRWFIRKNQSGLMHNSSGNRHPLLLAAGQLIHRLLRHGIHPQLLQSVHRLYLCLPE